MTQGQYIGDVFTVEDASGAASRYVLRKAFPSDRDTAPADRTGERRAVESTVLIYEDTENQGNGVGDGIFLSKRKGVELTFYVEPESPAQPIRTPEAVLTGLTAGLRVNMARELGRAEAAVKSAKVLRFGPLRFDVDRAYIARRSPTDRGYKVTAVFLGVDNDQEFKDTDGTPVPLI